LYCIIYCKLYIINFYSIFHFSRLLFHQRQTIIRVLVSKSGSHFSCCPNAQLPMVCTSTSHEQLTSYMYSRQPFSSTSCQDRADLNRNLGLGLEISHKNGRGNKCQSRHMKVWPGLIRCSLSFLLGRCSLRHIHWTAQPFY